MYIRFRVNWVASEAVTAFRQYQTSSEVGVNHKVSKLFSQTLSSTAVKLVAPKSFETRLKFRAFRVYMAFLKALWPKKPKKWHFYSRFWASKQIFGGTDLECSFNHYYWSSEYPINRAGSIFLSIWIKKPCTLIKKRLYARSWPWWPTIRPYFGIFDYKNGFCSQKHVSRCSGINNSFWFVGLAQWIGLTPIPRL